MAELNSLSQLLEGFKNFYDGEMQSVSGVSSSVASSLSTAANTLSDAMSLFSKASSDSAISSLNGGVALAKEGIERVKSHVEGDIASLLGDAGSLRTGTIQKILDKIEEGKAWKEASTEKDEDGKTITKQNDQAKINEANQYIDRMNSKGEAQLNAMAAAINGVAFGVTGNMTLGGSLGKSTTYADGYHFNGDEWEKDNPEPKYEEPKEEDKKVDKVESEPLTFIEGVGAVASGVVSAPLKLVEGVADFGAMILGGIVSIFSREAADSIYDFASKDLTNELSTAIMGEKITNSDLYKGTQSVAKYAGYQVARCIAPPIGAMAAQVAMSGNAMEKLYARTGRADISIGAGLLLEEIQGRLNAGGGKLATDFAKETAAYVLPEVVTRVADPGDTSNKKEDKKEE